MTVDPSLKIVTLIASATEIVCALGLEKNLVGRSHECDFPVSITSLPICSSMKFQPDGTSYDIHQKLTAIVQEGLSVYKVNSELLNVLQPNVIITQDQCEVCAVSFKDLESAVCEVIASRPRIVSLKTDNLTDLWTDIMKVASACGVEREGQQLVDKLKTRMEKIAYHSNLAASHDGRPKVASIEWIEPLMTAGNWMPELVELAGGSNCLGEAGKHSPWIKWEDIVNSDPDILFISPCGFSVERTKQEMHFLKSLPGWNNLKAVQNNKVFIADGNAYFHRPGPRLVESLEIMAQIIHPSHHSKVHTLENAFCKIGGDVTS